jgi:dTMP kinase
MKKIAEKGLFITFEGGEGGGKTSVINKVQKDLEKRGIAYIKTREPGGIPIADEIRTIILSVNNTAMDERTEALLYAAARRQHLVEKVVPALKLGMLVICDRFVDSSLVYQGHARGLGIDEIFRINQFAIDDLMPDLTLWLDIDPVIGLERIHSGRSQEINRLDLESLAFHQKVREGYQILHERYPNRIQRIDANQTLEEVHRDVQKVIMERIAKKDIEKIGV